MAGCRPLSDEEIALVLESFTGAYAIRNKCLFVFGICSGYRISEILAVRVGDVEQHGKIVDFVTVEAKNMKGKRRGRTVALHRDAKQAIAALLDEYEAKWGRRMTPDLFLFRSQQGVNRPLSRSHVGKFLHDIYRQHHFTGKLGTHVLRKVFAQKMWRRLDKDIVKVAHAMGHSSVNSTAKYVCNFSDSEIQQAILA